MSTECQGDCVIKSPNCRADCTGYPRGPREPPEPSATPSTLERLLAEVAEWDIYRSSDDVRQFLADVRSKLAALRPSEGPAQEPTREWLQKRCAWYQNELDLVTLERDALRTAALPHPSEGPETGDRPTLKSLADHLGWGYKSDKRTWEFAVHREHLLRHAQTLLETEKSNAATTEGAITVNALPLADAEPE